VPDPLCGTTVGGTLLLSADVANCPRTGLVLGSGAVLDCAGHSITGFGGTYGVLLDGAIGAEVRNCRITGFGRGVRIAGGSANRVHDNETPANRNYGIEFSGATSGNRIEANLVEGNGDEGIHVGSGADGNEIIGNTVRGSVRENLYLLNASGNLAEGNTLESAGAASLFVKNSSGNTFRDNRVGGGIAQVRGDSHDNLFEGNDLVDHGYQFEGYAETGGLWQFPHHNTVEGGSIVGADVCFTFLGAHDNLARHVVAQGCTPILESPLGGETPSNNVVQICGDGISNGDETCDAGKANGTPTGCCSVACELLSGHTCRAAASECDIAEACDGKTAACPADGFAAAGTACAPDALVCSRDECNGAGACTHPAGNAGTVCRAAVGECDVPETCTGANRNCPSDKLAVSGFICRRSAGECDVVEKCSGASPSCPVDVMKPADTLCRAAAGTCDVAESCDGASAACPVDAIQPAGFVCRPAADPCDFAERCDGTNVACAEDAVKPDGRRCSDDDTCTTSDACKSGVCTGAPVECAAPDACHLAGSCDPASGACRPQPIPCGPCESCDPTTGACATGPREGCAPSRPGGSRLLILDRRKDELDSLLWKWTSTTGTTRADFGDPTTSEDYALCIFDQAGGSAHLVLRAEALAGGDCAGAPCWTATAEGFQYTDPGALRDGLGAFKLETTAEGSGTLRVTGTGTNLPTPALPLVPPILVQAQSSAGACWESTFSNPERNGRVKVRGFSD